MNYKKGQSLPLNTIAIAVLVLIVLLLVSIGFITQLNKNSKATEEISDEYTGKYTSVISFNPDEFGRTEISIEVAAEGESPVDVYHTIPKEVISELTYENRVDYIESDLDYVIIETDPLIAWHVEKPPATINYTINKEISQEDRNNFKVDIKESEKFSYLTFLTYFLIIVIIILVIEPLFKNQKRK